MMRESKIKKQESRGRQRKSVIPAPEPGSIAVITGKVIRGDGFGRELGFPTANIDRRDYLRQRLDLKFGIYAGVAVGGADLGRPKTYKAAVVIGPLDKKGLPKLEAHLVDFKGNLYGKPLTVTLIKFLRSYKSFKTIEQLKAQIALDVEKVKPIV